MYLWNISYEAKVNPNWGDDRQIRATPPLNKALNPSSLRIRLNASAMFLYAFSPGLTSTCNLVLITSHGVVQEVDGTERNVSQHAGRSTFIKTLESKCSDNINGRLLDVRNAFLGHLSNGLTLNLQSDLGDFQRIGEDHLTSTSRRTGQDLPAHGQFAVLAVLGTESSDQIVDGQFDGLFRSHTDQLRQQSGVETNQSFVLEHFTETVTVRAVKRVSLLVLHSGFN
ncbi:hypothetical protein OGAPHI_002060 [Ogataea philodendri]|uniref:Uncharacterized protein n=1 Tax=Ogataea philodendri TaxID=1378263 RepID=A0A9P8PAR3_9ASCO|nr:uncharacterized protein OGAPHI_002060 [Ogataea philodendri]KAH3668306.1 hypothetical protein OGAPHI_002060 [Ogataea philodendri]